jgi:hypothetical protein
MSAIIKYVKDKKGNRRGILIGLKADNDVLIGWSQCNKYYDNFCKEKGIEIAVGRADKYFNADFEFVSNKMPVDVRKLMGDFILRCERYFKEGTFPVWTIGY